MAVNVTSFLTAFPEFLESDPQRILAYTEQVLCEGCYDQFTDQCVSDLAVQLHVAHLLAVYDQSSFSSKFATGGQKVLKLKTKHDEIQFMQSSPGDPYGFSNTQYGTRLQALIARHSVGFTMTFC